AAQNDLESKRRVLQTVGGKEFAQLKPLRSDIRLPPPNPDNMQSWVDIAERQAYPVLAQEAATQVAQLEAKRASGAQWPTLDLAVINGIAQVGALEQALVSSQSALDSNKLGYEVGVRINIDVLNAQQQLYQTRRDLAVARYNAIINHLKLKAAAGTLRDEDLE